MPPLGSLGLPLEGDPEEIEEIELLGPLLEESSGGPLGSLGPLDEGLLDGKLPLLELLELAGVWQQHVPSTT